MNTKKTLIDILKEFDKNRTYNRNSEKTWDEEAVAACFYECAKQILCDGYFLINDEFIIDLGSIELYYHEEDGAIKDHIMYHTNEHISKSKLIELNGGYPYFKLGSFNLHQSGVDVTFENGDEGKKYRASFLIRSYRVLRKGNEHELNDLTIPFDKCSTHLFDDMFYTGIQLLDNEMAIEWRGANKSREIEQNPRKNVAMYNGFEKVTKEDYDSNKCDIKTKVLEPQFFRYNGKDYLKENRQWQYKRIGIIEQ